MGVQASIARFFTTVKQFSVTFARWRALVSGRTSCATRRQHDSTPSPERRRAAGALSPQNEVPAYAAPARATALAHLPPTLTFAGNLDPFYDETRAYVAALRAENVPTEFATYRGAYHGFHTLPKSARVSQGATAWFNAQLRHFTQTYFAEQPPQRWVRATAARPRASIANR